MKRIDRIEVLRDILLKQRVGGQNEILKQLAARGFSVTQATLSRDLRRMKAVKISTETGFVYVLPEHPLYRRNGELRLAPDYLRQSGFISLDFSGNLAVMHTRPGYAAGMAVEIDASSLAGIVGTLAGDDTVLIIMAEDLTRQQLVDELAQLFPAVKSVIP